MAYEGLRPEEALALEDRHTGKATLLIEQKNVDGDIIAGQKISRPPRSPDLWAPVRRDLAEYHRGDPSRADTRGCTAADPASRWRALARLRLPQLASSRLQASDQGRGTPDQSALRSSIRVREPDDPRWHPFDRDRRPHGPLRRHALPNLRAPDRRHARPAANVRHRRHHVRSSATPPQGQLRDQQPSPRHRHELGAFWGHNRCSLGSPGGVLGRMLGLSSAVLGPGRTPQLPS